jgi:ABC-type sulfate/molybdate transport systems ATPase subunit
MSRGCEDAEANVLELALEARRGNFHLQVECKLAEPWTVIFGPSGAGKTTLLRLIAGLDRTHGEGLRGRVVSEERTLTDTESGLWLQPGHRKIGFVTQQAALFPHLTAAENTRYGLRAMDPTAREARVEEMLELVDASELAARHPQDLSGGQAQRITLARALAPRPSLLLLDEPFSALDGVASDALLSRLQEWLRQNNVQVILATHDATDALAIGAEVLLLCEGHIAAQGPAAGVLADERQRLLSRLQSS